MAGDSSKPTVSLVVDLRDVYEHLKKTDICVEPDDPVCTQTGPCDVFIKGSSLLTQVLQALNLRHKKPDCTIDDIHLLKNVPFSAYDIADCLGLMLNAETVPSDRWGVQL
jgi:hypothetical protein